MIGSKGKPGGSEWDLLRAIVSDETYAERIAALEDRYDRIEKASGGKDRLAQADKILAEAERAREKSARVLSEAHIEAGDLRSTAQHESEALKREASSAVEKLLADAQAKDAAATAALAEAEEKLAYTQQNYDAIVKKDTEADQKLDAARNIAERASRREEQLRSALNG